MLSVASAALESHDPSELIMEKIVKVSQVSSKTLYNYFNNRDLLLLKRL
ncbi:MULTISPECIES: TetR family transcriptional regulator [unclassified Microbulbifer]